MNGTPSLLQFLPSNTSTSRLTWNRQALEFNAREEFNHKLFLEVAELGAIGITVPEESGGSGMDAVASVRAAPPPTPRSSENGLLETRARAQCARICARARVPVHARVPASPHVCARAPVAHGLGEAH